MPDIGVDAPEDPVEGIEAPLTPFVGFMYALPVLTAAGFLDQGVGAAVLGLEGARAGNASSDCVSSAGFDGAGGASFAGCFPAFLDDMASPEAG